MDFQSPQNGMYDPSSFIDPSAIANPQMNGTRSYPMSSIPQKRDSTGATLSLSRSQTPSQPGQFGFQQQQQAFTHTPSPTMQNQNFAPGQMGAQRMQTASPAQNSHAQQMASMGFQGSPMAQGFNRNAAGQFPVQSVQLSQNLQSLQHEAQRQHAMRMQVQQQQMGNMGAGNMAAQQRPQGAQMSGGMQHPGMQPGMQPGMMQQQQGQQQNAQAQFQVFIKNVAALLAQHGRTLNPQPQCAGRMINLQNLYAVVMRFKGYRYVTQSQAWPKIAQMLNINLQQFPTAPEELRQIYEANLGLYENAFTQRQQQLKNMPQQGQVGQMGQMGQMGAMGTMGPQMSPTRPSMPGQRPDASAQQQYMQQLQRHQDSLKQQQQQQPQHRPQPPPVPQAQPQFDPSTQPQQTTPLQANANLANINGATPQPDVNARKSMSRQLEGTPTQGQEPSQAQPSPMKQEETSATAEAAAVAAEEPEKRKPVIEQDDGTRVYQPAYRTQDTWGGLDFDSDNFKNMIETITTYKPNVPMLPELGIIDVRALTMSLRSGLHAETRLALDTLTRITYDNNVQFNLSHCEDLTDVLVEFAEDQLEILGNDNPEVTDILDLTPYEDVLHHCRAEAATLQELPEAGTQAYLLDRTADRLLAVTTILRNLSFLEVNHDSLVGSSVLKFLANFIRLVGTRVLLLRTHINTFDFMKDVITFFSNTSAKIVLPSREDAYAVLHFLCAFAPCPRPAEPVKFTPFNPQIHRYLPSAVDSLAKLLARDDPNRTYYKQIFVNEATYTPAYDLLTRSFALAISVVPDRNYIENRMYSMKESRPKEIRLFEARIADSRKAYLMQGMLAADILASLAPGAESGVCRSWLESEDGWAHSLIKFAMSLSSTDATMPLPPPPPPNHRGQRPMDHDREGFQLIVHRALSTLKRLGEKSKGTELLIKPPHQINGHMHLDDDDSDDDEEMEQVDFNGSLWMVKADILPPKETLLSALLTPQLDVRSLNQFCKIGYLDE